ncbi:phosphatase PAP2 family protein [Naasia sp. SYSU D00057]|uniref:phosphatase PAP2 family protein n=1 Tax=Naasia sp. SYSU D00057 TaxID=2817380 RepID=UPI001B30CAEA|nr:phosphatase PAP2 family protein [Naasia sp. SYSU D00057]
MSDTQSLHRQDRQTLEVQRKWPLVSGIIALALVILGGVLIAIRQFEVVPYEVDQEWMDELYENRTPFWEGVARFFDRLGGGLIGVVIVPVAIILVLLLVRRRWGALYFLTASVLSAGLVQLIKNTVDRPRPEQILVVADFGSFPSGHTANAATIAVVLALIINRWWVWPLGAAYTICMLLSRNYLGAHWLTDTLGGLLLGAAVALIVWAPFAHRLHRETLRKRDVAPAPGVPEA